MNLNLKAIIYKSTKCLPVIIWIMICPGIIFGQTGSDDPFPSYESLKPNITFWKKIYTEYSTQEVLFHDRRNPSIIYGVVQLKEKDEPGAGKYNKNIVETYKKRYVQLLKRLSSVGRPESPEEKELYKIFEENNLLSLLKEAHLNIRAQLGQKDRFRTGLIRSGAYINEIMEILRSYNLPEDIAYLPHVESSFNYQAYSRFGAAGIWQFTRDTGRRYMKIDYTVDERRDPILATHAAAKYLKESYALLGNWPSAITSYNHGVQGMLKAKDKNGDFENIFNEYDGRTFGFASKNFYCEFLAAREIASDYRKYFGDLSLETPVRRTKVEVPGYVSVNDLAQYFGVSIDTIKELNPALREPVYSDQKYIPTGCVIYLPPLTVADSSSDSAEIPARLIKSNQKPSLFYRVMKGDTAQKIARENNVKLNDLILANGLNSRATVYIGQNLRIPVSGEKTVIVSGVEGSGTINSPPLLVAEASIPDKAPASITGVEATEETPAVTSETMDTTMEDNPVPLTESSQIAAESSMVNPSVVTGDFSVSDIRTVKGMSVGTITVEAEETLGHYADWLHIETRKIRSLNGFSGKKAIHIGEKIKIPIDKANAEAFEEERFEYHKEIEEDFFAAYQVEKVQEYTVQRGDNIWELCTDKFELPFWILKKYNPEKDFNHLLQSDTLMIPVVNKIGS